MVGFFFLFMMVIIGMLGLVAGLQRSGMLTGRDSAAREGLTREQLHRLEEALGSLDARLDRLEDQQRFLERLLEERPEPRSLPPAPEGSKPESEEPERGVDSVLFDVERGEP